MRAVSYVFLAAAAFSIPIGSVHAQIAFLPDPATFVATAAAEGIARCESQQWAERGATKKFLINVQTASPDFFGDAKVSEIAEKAIGNVASRPNKIQRSECSQLINVSATLPNELACMRRTSKTVEENKKEFDHLFQKSMNTYNGAQLCIGVWARDVRRSAVSTCAGPGPHFVAGEVQTGSRAERAGLKEGDELLTVNGHPIRFHLDFELAVMSAKPGSELIVRVMREKSIEDVPAKVGLMTIKPGEPALCIGN